MAQAFDLSSKAPGEEVGNFSVFSRAKRHGDQRSFDQLIPGVGAVGVTEIVCEGQALGYGGHDQISGRLAVIIHP